MAILLLTTFYPKGNLLSLLMCVYVAIFAVDRAAALKYNCCALELSLAGHSKKGSVHRRGAQYVNV